MTDNKKDNRYWYRLKIRNKGIIEEAEKILRDSSIEFVSFMDKATPAYSLQYLANKYIQFIYVNTDINTILSFLERENEKKIFKLGRDNHNNPITYDNLTVRQTETILRDYKGEFRIANSIPTKAKECSINYLQIKGLKGYYQKVQKAPIDKFYIKLLENIDIFIPVPKDTFKEVKEKLKKEDEKKLRERTRWMVLRTFDEEKWYDLLCNWNIEMSDSIKNGEVRPCFPFLPKMRQTSKNGKNRIKLLCHGYLFLKTSIDNISHIERNKRYGIPNIGKAIMKINCDGKSIPITINEHAMTDFMFATSLITGELKYDSFDYCIDEHVVYINPDSPFFGRVGKLSRKGKDLYLAFSLGNQLNGSIKIPAIKVDISMIRKLTDEEVAEYEDM